MKTFSQQKGKWKVKDVDTQEVRDKNRNEKQLSATYEDISFAKAAINKGVNIFCVIGAAGIVLAVFAGIFWG